MKNQPNNIHEPYTKIEGFFLYIYEPDQKLLPTLPNFEKKHCPCILKGRLTTNSILSAFHRQGLKSNIICSLSISKQAINWGFIPELTPIIKHIINLEVKNIAKSSLT